MNELTKEQIDQCWDSQVSGYGRSRYDIARAIIQADRAQRQAGQVARPDDEGHHGFAHAGPFQGVADQIIGMIRERQAGQEPTVSILETTHVSHVRQVLEQALDAMRPLSDLIALRQACEAIQALLRTAPDHPA